MEIFRRYGEEPYDVVVVHGGPGAPGDAAKLAVDISEYHGVVEPLLSSKSIDGQLEELKIVIEENCDKTVELIGHSYGAWLSLIFSKKYPTYVNKLILVASGPFESKYKSSIMQKRLERLDEEEKEELFELFQALSNPTSLKDEEITRRLDILMSKTDSFEMIEHKNEVLEFQPQVHQKIWKEAEKLREEGKLLEYAGELDCPVVAVHGDYDPHPYKGVKEPLSRIIDDFKFVLLERCGHYPWYERYARDEFLMIIKDELR